MLKTLEGVKVVDMTLAAAGPGCSRLLAEFGANDIWVEPVDGTFTTRYLGQIDFYAGGGKRSLALNIKTKEGMEVLHRLIRDADVFISNYRPQALEKLGLTYEDLEKINPRIIYATVTGWGEAGPKKHDPGYDTVCFWSETGLLSSVSEKGTMSIPTPGIGDSLVGQALGMGICAALYRREKTGKGMKIWTSLYAEALYSMQHAIVMSQLGTEYPQTRKDPEKSLLNTYQCGDGVWIAMLTQKMEQFWELLHILGRDDLVNSPVYRKKWKLLSDTYQPNSAEIVSILDEAVAKFTAQELMDLLHKADIPCAKIKTALEQSTPMPAEQALANFNMVKIHPWTNCQDKDIWMPACPVKFGELDPGEQKLAPRVGEHTVEILKEHGYSEMEIRDLMDKGIAAKTDGNGVMK